MRIGFIGIGAMGRHMSRHLIESGFELMVNDIRKEAATEVLSRGASWAEHPEAISGACEVVMTSLPTPADVEMVIYGKNGLKEGWKPGDIYIDMSTNSPSLIRKIALDASIKGVEVLDAPVSGGTQGAESGKLSIIVGGNANTLSRVRNIFEAIGNAVFHVGDVGCGNIAKLINNMIALGCSQATAEGMVLGAKAGIDISILRDIIRNSTGNNYFADHGLGQIFKGDFEPGFRVNLAIKDMGLALGLARENNVSTPVGAVAEQGLLAAKASGLGEKGVQSVIIPFEKLADVTVRVSKTT